MLQWVFTRFASLDEAYDILPSLCHPSYYKVRTAHVVEKYTARVVEVRRRNDLHLDFGGPVCVDDPCIEIRLGPHRIFSCWQHQANLALYTLLNSHTVRHGRIYFRRFSRWPGTVCFISEKDCKRVVRVLRGRVDPVFEAEHKVRTREVLIKANTAIHGKTSEAAIRKFFQGEPN